MIVKKQPRFSVIVPAYNSEAFLNKCIESVLEQTYSDFELILVDDGSNDRTLDICDLYAKRDSKIKVIHKKNGGHTSARNEGLRASNGEYILFLDSDDWLSRQTLEICEANISAHNSDIVVFQIKNSIASRHFPILIKDGFYCVDSIEKKIWPCFIMGADGKFAFPKSLSAKCFKREIILDSQFSVPEEILIGEDGAAFVGAVLKSSKISVIASDNRACYNCLVRIGSVSRSSDTKAFFRVSVLLGYYEKILPLEQSTFSLQFERYVVAQLYAATLLLMRSGADNKKLNDELSFILKDVKIFSALKKAKFSLRGYKFLIKKFLLRHRLWGIIRLLNR